MRGGVEVDAGHLRRGRPKHFITLNGRESNEGRCWCLLLDLPQVLKRARRCKKMQEALSTQAISVVCVFLFLTVAYYAMTSKVTAKASVLFTTTCAFGMLVSLLQSIGIIGMMTVDWPVDLNGFFAYFQVLLLDLDSFGFAPWRWTSPWVPLDVVCCFWQLRGLEDHDLRKVFHQGLLCRGED